MPATQAVKISPSGIDSTGRLQADGTMTGVVKAHFVDLNDAHEVVRQTDQEIPWTAVRTTPAPAPAREP